LRQSIGGILSTFKDSKTKEVKFSNKKYYKVKNLRLIKSTDMAKVAQNHYIKND
jgi:hypothetical protein